jgi:DNA-binding response OmpR family regulator
MYLSHPYQSGHFSLFQPTGSGTRVLVADDDQNLQLSLIRAGHQVIPAANDAEIWKQFEEQDIDLVVINLLMPGIDGLAICRQLRQRSHVPIILVTPEHSETTVMGLDVGADDAVNHPVSPIELVARVQTLLRCVRRMKGHRSRANNLCLEAVSIRQYVPSSGASLPGDLILWSSSSVEELHP